MFVLRCAFGGAHESFVLCGSEDATITVWSKEKGQIVTKLQGGHTQVVNSVNWCPTDPLLLITASDDQTLRLWGSESMAQCDVITDHKDLKRIDQVKGGASDSHEDIDEDEDDGDEEGDDDEEDFESGGEEEDEYRQRQMGSGEEVEEAMEDEEEYRPILRASRVARRRRSGRIVEEEDEEEWAEEEGSRL